MARPANIAPLESQVEIGNATGSQIQTHLDFLLTIVEQADGYNAFQEAIGISVGNSLDSGFLRVADDGQRATTTTDTPRSFNGVVSPFVIKDSSNV